MINLDKREELIRLFDNYNELLTEKQKLYFELYYYNDLSLAEIAEEQAVSRNAIFDQLKKTALILERYESILHQVRNKDIINKALEHNNIDDLKNCLNEIFKE